MDIPDAVTVGVVLYTPHKLGRRDLEREAAHAATVAARLGTPAEKAHGQAIARLVPTEAWRALLTKQGLDPDTELLASVHFFRERPAPALVAGALAVFAHAWLFRREHGVEPPGSLPLSDLPPGPLAKAKVLRDAADTINAVMLDDVRYADWMRAFESAWSAEPAGS
jgi:hypothetical protein